jgi:hypothetical protein
MPTGHTPKLKCKQWGLLCESIGSLQRGNKLCVEPSQAQDKVLGDDSCSNRSSSPVFRPSTPSTGMSVSASSSRASTPFDNTEHQSTAHRHTSISVFPQGHRNYISVKQHVSGYRSALKTPVETDRDEDYEDRPCKDGPCKDRPCEDGPCEDGPWVDVDNMAPKPKKTPAKRPCTTDKATAVSPISNCCIHLLTTGF